MSKELELIAEVLFSRLGTEAYQVSQRVVSKLSEHGYSIVQRDRLARAMYLDQARRFVHSDDSMTPEQSWDEGFFERKSLWLAHADRLLAAAAAVEEDTNG